MILLSRNNISSQKFFSPKIDEKKREKKSVQPTDSNKLLNIQEILVPGMTSRKRKKNYIHKIYYTLIEDLLQPLDPSMVPFLLCHSSGKLLM